MNSKNDEKDVNKSKSSSSKGKSYFVELYKGLDARLNGDGALTERVPALCELWQKIHALCQHSAPSTHPHLLIWVQKHTAKTVFQTEWQSPKRKSEQDDLEQAIDDNINETELHISSRNGNPLQWEVQLLQKARWFKKLLRDPWENPVLKALLDPNGEKPDNNEVLAWMRGEGGVPLSWRLRQLSAARCDDLALTLASRLMDCVRDAAPPISDNDPMENQISPTKSPGFGDVLSKEAYFTDEVWEFIMDMELVLLHKLNKHSRCIELVKQVPLCNGYALVERLRTRLERAPHEKRIWKNSKDVATLVAQVVMARCMVVSVCAGRVRACLYGCARSLARLTPRARLPPAAAALAPIALSAAHLHTLAAAMRIELNGEMVGFVCEMYVRALTAGFNELDKLKLHQDKEAEVHGMERQVSAWLVQLGGVLAGSARVHCECLLTAFSVYPAPDMYDKICKAPLFAPLPLDKIQDTKTEEKTSEFDSWSCDSRRQTIFVKTSETLNLKRSQGHSSVLSAAILTEGEALGLAPELCEDLTVLLSGPRIKTFSWDIDRNTLLKDCQAYMERTGGGTRALVTELKFLNIDHKKYQHLKEEDEDEEDIYYGIEKGYEHLLELEDQDSYDPNTLSDPEKHDDNAKIKDFVCRRSKSCDSDSEAEVDPLGFAIETDVENKKSRSRSKERKIKHRRKNKLISIDHNTNKAVHESQTKNASNHLKTDNIRKESDNNSEQSHLKNYDPCGIALGGSHKNSECQENNVVIDGEFSMDEIKSPEKEFEHRITLNKPDVSSDLLNKSTCMVSESKLNINDNNYFLMKTKDSEPSAVATRQNNKQSLVKTQHNILSNIHKISCDSRRDILKLLQYRRVRSKILQNNKPAVINKPTSSDNYLTLCKDAKPTTKSMNESNIEKEQQHIHTSLVNRELNTSYIIKNNGSSNNDDDIDQKLKYDYGSTQNVITDNMLEFKKADKRAFNDDKRATLTNTSQLSNILENLSNNSSSSPALNNKISIIMANNLDSIKKVSQNKNNNVKFSPVLDVKNKDQSTINALSTSKKMQVPQTFSRLNFMHKQKQSHQNERCKQMPVLHLFKHNESLKTIDYLHSNKSLIITRLDNKSKNDITSIISKDGNIKISDKPFDKKTNKINTDMNKSCKSILAPITKKSETHPKNIHIDVSSISKSLASNMNTDQGTTMKNINTINKYSFTQNTVIKESCLKDMKPSLILEKNDRCVQNSTNEPFFNASELNRTYDKKNLTVSKTNQVKNDDWKSVMTAILSHKTLRRYTSVSDSTGNNQSQIKERKNIPPKLPHKSHITECGHRTTVNPLVCSGETVIKSSHEVKYKLKHEMNEQSLLLNRLSKSKVTSDRKQLLSHTDRASNDTVSKVPTRFKHNLCPNHQSNNIDTKRSDKSKSGPKYMDSCFPQYVSDINQTQNSEYDLLEELIDDDLRQEIRELSDEDSCNYSTQKSYCRNGHVADSTTFVIANEMNKKLKFNTIHVKTPDSHVPDKMLSASGGYENIQSAKNLTVKLPKDVNIQPRLNLASTHLDTHKDHPSIKRVVSAIDGLNKNNRINDTLKTNVSCNIDSRESKLTPVTVPNSINHNEAYNKTNITYNQNVVITPFNSNIVRNVVNYNQNFCNQYVQIPQINLVQQITTINDRPNIASFATAQLPYYTSCPIVLKNPVKIIIPSSTSHLNGKSYVPWEVTKKEDAKLNHIVCTDKLILQSSNTRDIKYVSGDLVTNQNTREAQKKDCDIESIQNKSVSTQFDNIQYVSGDLVVNENTREAQKNDCDIESIQNKSVCTQVDNIKYISGNLVTNQNTREAHKNALDLECNENKNVCAQVDNIDYVKQYMDTPNFVKSSNMLKTINSERVSKKRLNILNRKIESRCFYPPIPLPHIQLNKEVQPNQKSKPALKMDFNDMKSSEYTNLKSQDIVDIKERETKDQILLTPKNSNVESLNKKLKHCLKNNHEKSTNQQNMQQTFEKLKSKLSNKMCSLHSKEENDKKDDNFSVKDTSLSLDGKMAKYEFANYSIDTRKRVLKDNDKNKSLQTSNKKGMESNCFHTDITKKSVQNEAKHAPYNACSHDIIDKKMIDIDSNNKSSLLKIAPNSDCNVDIEDQLLISKISKNLFGDIKNKGDFSVLEKKSINVKATVVESSSSKLEDFSFETSNSVDKNLPVTLSLEKNNDKKTHTTNISNRLINEDIQLKHEDTNSAILETSESILAQKTLINNQNDVNNISRLTEHQDVILNSTNITNFNEEKDESKTFIPVLIETTNCEPNENLIEVNIDQNTKNVCGVELFSAENKQNNNYCLRPVNTERSCDKNTIFSNTKLQQKSNELEVNTIKTDVSTGHSAIKAALNSENSTSICRATQVTSNKCLDQTKKSMLFNEISSCIQKQGDKFKEGKDSDKNKIIDTKNEEQCKSFKNNSDTITTSNIPKSKSSEMLYLHSDSKIVNHDFKYLASTLNKTSKDNLHLSEQKSVADKKSTSIIDNDSKEAIHDTADLVNDQNLKLNSAHGIFEKRIINDLSTVTIISDNNDVNDKESSFDITTNCNTITNNNKVKNLNDVEFKNKSKNFELITLSNKNMLIDDKNTSSFLKRKNSDKDLFNCGSNDIKLCSIYACENRKNKKRLCHKSHEKPSIAEQKMNSNYKQNTARSIKNTTTVISKSKTNIKNSISSDDKSSQIMSAYNAEVPQTPEDLKSSPKNNIYNVKTPDIEIISNKNTINSSKSALIPDHNEKSSDNRNANKTDVQFINDANVKSDSNLFDNSKSLMQQFNFKVISSDANRKTLLVTLPNKKTVKMTVTGKLLVDFDVLCSDPLFKSNILNSLKEPKSFISYKQTIDANNPDLVSLAVTDFTKSVAQNKLDIVDLISDSEEELQVFKTEFGEFKVSDVSQKLFAKHQSILNKKCLVLAKNESFEGYYNNISKIPVQNIHLSPIKEKKLDKNRNKIDSNEVIEILESPQKADFVPGDELHKPEIIEILDSPVTSPNPYVENTQLKPVERSEKIKKLTEKLVMELGLVDNNDNYNITSLPDENNKNVKAVCEYDKNTNNVLNELNEDNILNVDVVNSQLQSQNPTDYYYDTNNDEDKCSNNDALSSCGSISLLADFEENTFLPDITTSCNVNEDFNNKYALYNKSDNCVSCISDWLYTKKDLSVCYKIVKRNENNNSEIEMCKKSKDTVDVPNLISIVTHYFQQNPEAIKHFTKSKKIFKRKKHLQKSVIKSYKKHLSSADYSYEDITNMKHYNSKFLHCHKSFWICDQKQNSSLIDSTNIVKTRQEEMSQTGLHYSEVDKNVDCDLSFHQSRRSNIMSMISENVITKYIPPEQNMNTLNECSDKTDCDVVKIVFTDEDMQFTPKEVETQTATCVKLKNNTHLSDSKNINKLGITDSFIQCSSAATSRESKSVVSMDHLENETKSYNLLVSKSDKDYESNLSFSMPTLTYSKSKVLKRKMPIKRNENIKKYRNGKNIDYPKLTLSAISDSAYNKEYKLLFEYYNSLKFSYSQPFHKDFIEVHDILKDWPIKIKTCTKSYENNEAISTLFKDDEDTENCNNLNVSEKSLSEEISQEEEVPFTSQNIEETNFKMGFGERSGSVNFGLVKLNNLSAATLSDVKHLQPLPLLCNNLINSRDDNKLPTSDYTQNMQRYFKYIQLRDKVRSYFKRSAFELNCDCLKQIKKVDKKRTLLTESLVSDLIDLDFIEPFTVETFVNVVQVGQLTVSAAATQNSATCDTRISHVTDVSNNHIQNLGDNEQNSLKNEYTEMKNADLNSHIVQPSEMSTLPLDSLSDNIKDNEESGHHKESRNKVTDEPNSYCSTIASNKKPCENLNREKDTFPYNNNCQTNEVHLKPNNSTITASILNKSHESYAKDKSQNMADEKTDQLAHAMNAAGITSADISSNTNVHALVNLLSQKICQNTTNEIPNDSDVPNKTIDTMSLQQALSQILPPLNHSNVTESTRQGSKTLASPKILHIVPGKSNSANQITLIDSTQQSVLASSNATQLLHIVHNKNIGAGSTNGTQISQSNAFGTLSLVDTSIQQGGNQLLHIVNTGTQNSHNSGHLLKRVNLLTNLSNVQNPSEQKMVQFVCKSTDGKSLQLNTSQQRGMVLRLQPIEAHNYKSAPAKPGEVRENIVMNTADSASSKEDSHEIKSRSVYEENYAKFIQNSSTNQSKEKSTSLPKFNQVFGKPIFQDDSQNTNNNNNINNANSSVTVVQSANDSETSNNPISIDQTNSLSSGSHLKKQLPAATQPQPNLVQQIKHAIAPMNIQTMHGGVIYTRQIPVNIGGGQTINLITVPTTELIDESNIKSQSEVKFLNQSDIEPSIIKIIPQSQITTTEVPGEEAKTSNNSDNTSQQILTQMRIKLPMLSKTPQVVPGTRLVRPSFFQIQRNVIGGANQPVYQQLLLTAAPPLTHQIRLPQTQVKPAKTTSDNQSENQMSSSTLEQLREFDMVLEQVIERSGVQPIINSVNCSNKQHEQKEIDKGSESLSSNATNNQTHVLYSLGSNQTLNLSYVNKKTTVTSNVTPTYVHSPDSTVVADSPSSSTSTQNSQSVSNESSEITSAKPKCNSKSKSRPKNPNITNSLKINAVPQKTSTQKPLEDEQTTQRILYILAEYKEQVENSPDKDKPAPRRRSNPPTNPCSSSKRKKSSNGSRKSGGREGSPINSEDTCRTMGSEDSSCGTSQGDCTENCQESHSPQDSPRKVARKLGFEQESNNKVPTQPHNLIVADGQTITVARGPTGKPATAVIMPANYILPVSMVKGGQQIAIVTNRGPKLLAVSNGEGRTTNTLFLQRLISPAGLKPVLTRPGIRHVRLPATALQNLQAFNLATSNNSQPPDSTASPAPAPTPPDLNECQDASSPWANCESQSVKTNCGTDGQEPWNLPSSSETRDFNYEETVRSDNLDRTVLVVQKKDGPQRQHRLSHVSAAALRHKYAILEHELRLQKSLSEECEDLGVDSPSASDLFPEAELLFAASPAHEPHAHTKLHQTSIISTTIPQPDIDDQIATDQLIPQNPTSLAANQQINLGLEDEGIVTVSEDGMQATVALDQEEFARSHPNTTFHSEPTEAEAASFTLTNLKPRHVASTIFHSNTASATVLMAAPQPSVISQAITSKNFSQKSVKYSEIENMINSMPGSHHNEINLSSVLVKDEGLTRFENMLSDTREVHLSNTASTIVHSASGATQVIRRVCYDEEKNSRDSSFLMDEPGPIIAGDDAKMVAEDNSREAILEAMVDDRSPERHGELFWESNSASEHGESRRPLDFSSDSEKCCKSPSYDTNSTDSSGVGSHVRLDTVIKQAISRRRSGSADGSSADDGHPPLRTYPPKRSYHSAEDVERSISGKTRAGETSPHSPGVRRRASGRGVVKRGCHCCNGSPAPPRTKKARQKKPDLN